MPFAYNPTADIVRYDIEFSFNRAGYTARTYVEVTSDLLGADLLASILSIPDDEPEDEEDDGDVYDDEDDVQEAGLLDYLAAATEDARNANTLMALMDDDEVVGFTLRLVTGDGRELTITDAFEDFLVGVRIINAVDLTQAEIDALDLDQDE